MYCKLAVTSHTPPPATDAAARIPLFSCQLSVNACTADDPFFEDERNLKRLPTGQIGETGGTVNR
jgi:hypothetical protein